MTPFSFLDRRKALVRVLALLVTLVSLRPAHANPTIVSTAPPTGANDVPLSAALVITFNETMNTGTTTAYLFASDPYEFLPTSLSWSAGDTVLTCTPTAALPAGRTILWTVSNGQNPAGDPLVGYTGGTFTTVAAVQLALTNPIWSEGTFAFDVTSPPGQSFTVEYSSALNSNLWQPLLTTNSPTGLVHIVDPHSTTNRSLFYRAFQLP